MRRQVCLLVDCKSWKKQKLSTSTKFSFCCNQNICIRGVCFDNRKVFYVHQDLRPKFLTELNKLSNKELGEKKPTPFTYNAYFVSLDMSIIKASLTKKC